MSRPNIAHLAKFVQEDMTTSFLFAGTLARGSIEEQTSSKGGRKVLLAWREGPESCWLRLEVRREE